MATDRAPLRIGGVLRCCADAVPDADHVAAEGEYRPCPHAEPDYPHGGLTFHRGAWQAAWIPTTEGESE